MPEIRSVFALAAAKARSAASSSSAADRGEAAAFGDDRAISTNSTRISCVISASLPRASKRCHGRGANQDASAILRAGGRMHLVLVLVAAALASQSPAERNFSGTWQMVAARSDSPTQTPPVTEMTFVIDH